MYPILEEAENWQELDNAYKWKSANLTAPNCYHTSMDSFEPTIDAHVNNDYR